MIARASSILALAAAGALSTGCFALLLGGFVVKSPVAGNARGTLGAQSPGDGTALQGDLLLPASLTTADPLNDATPLTSTEPLAQASPLQGNAGAGLAGNAGSSLIGNAGAGLAGNAGVLMAGGDPGPASAGGFMLAAEFYRLRPSALPAGFPAPTVQAVDTASGKVTAEVQAAGSSYRLAVPASYVGQGLIVQALFKSGTDVLAFLASPALGTERATTDLSLGSTLAAFTLARMAAVKPESLKLGTGFAGIANPEIGKLAARMQPEKRDLAASSNLVVTSTSFRKVMDTAGSLSGGVEKTARQKAGEASASGRTSRPPEEVRVTAALAVIDKATEVVAAEGTLEKALDRAAAEVRAEDVARRAEGREAKSRQQIEVVGAIEDLAAGVDRVRPSLACKGPDPWLAWQAGDRVFSVVLGAPRGAVEASAQAGTLPTLISVGRGLAAILRKGSTFPVTHHTADWGPVGGKHVAQRDFDLFSAAGGASSLLLAFDGPGRIDALRLTASPSFAAPETGRLELALSAAAGRDAPGRDARRPAATALGDAYLIVWDEADGAGRRIVGRFVQPDGTLSKEPIRIYPPRPDSRQRGGAAVAAGNGGFLVAWTEERDRFADVAAIRLNFDGSTEGAAFNLIDAAFDQRNPVLCWTGTRFGAAWDDRRVVGKRTLGTRIVTPRGELGPELALAANYAESPALASCGARLMAAWLEGEGGDRRVRAMGARIED